MMISNTILPVSKQEKLFVYFLREKCTVSCNRLTVNLVN